MTARTAAAVALALALAAPPATATSQGDALEPVPLPDLASLEPAVAEAIQALHEIVGEVSGRSEVSAPEQAAAMAALGQLLHAHGLAEAAAACYRNARRRDPNDFRWAHLLGLVLHRAGDLDAASAAWAEARALRPDYPATAIHLGRVLLERDRPAQAATILGAALALAPDDASVHAALGDLALAERRYPAAVEHFAAALERAPEADRLHYSLGMAWRGAGDLETARTHLARRGQVGVRPVDPLADGLSELVRGERVQLLRGRMAFAAGRYRDAAAAFQKAVTAAPNSARAWVNLGTALQRSGDVASAIAALESALEAEPGNPTAHFNLGALAVGRGDDEAARRHFEAVLAASEDDVEAHRQLAELHARADRGDLQLAHSNRVIELAPAAEAARIDLANLLISRRHYEESLEILEAGYRLDATSSRLRHALAQMLAACPDGRLRDGARALELATALQREEPTLANAEVLASALAEAGLCDQANRWRQQMLPAARAAGAAALAARLEAALEVSASPRGCRPLGLEPGAPGRGLSDN